MLTKLYLTNKEIAVYPLKIVENYDGFIFIDCFGRIYKKHKNFVPQSFCNNIFFISSNSFQQTHIKLRHSIRIYISRLLPLNIIAIGGESYLYGMLFCKNIIHYTNSKYIYDDCEFNNRIYRKNVENNLINYNLDKISDKHNFCLVNLSKLPIELMKKINDNLYLRVVIISCDHDDFWKKRRFLGNYRLVERKKFICWKIGYFISVNIFVPEFVSLGGNCAVTYHLNRLGIRKVAYPFDWCKIGYNNLVNVLRNNFEGFLDLEVVKYSENHGNSYVLKNKYCQFAHEVFHNSVTEFQKKLERRIERFRKLKKCVFVRIELQNFSDYSGLKNELEKHFNFKLIVVYGKDFVDWKFNNLDWDQILSG